MAETNSDLRVRRTRKTIQDAFRELALEKDLDHITVKELTDRAMINRKTFYLHYDSIEALFEEQLNLIMDRYFAEVETTPDVSEDLGGHARRFFMFMASQGKLTERLVCTRSHYDFGRNLYLIQMMRYKEAGGNPFEWMGNDKMELLLRYIRGTALEFYRGWVALGKRIPPEEAADLLAEITCNGASNLMR